MADKIIKVGARAPSFSLINQDGQKVTMKDFVGHWLVLYFYPKDDTPGCTKEACEFTSHLKYFTELKAKVFGISPDSVESHKKFIKKHDLKVELLSDPDHKVLAKYGAWGEKSMYGKKYEGVIRSTVIIDPQGLIAYHWPKVSPVGHANEVGNKLVELSED